MDRVIPQSAVPRQGDKWSSVDFTSAVHLLGGGTKNPRSKDRGLLSPILKKGGERDRIRTCDPVIKSHLLYQLSYAPDEKPVRCRCDLLV